jgi:Tfp pilus assembly protein PilV
MKIRAGIRGTSLLEVVIASVILFLVVGITMQILHSGMTASEKASITSNLESRSTRFMSFCKEDLMPANYNGGIDLGTPYSLGIPNTCGNTAVFYRVPGNLDDNGAPLSAGVLQYGYMCPLAAPNSGFRPNLACVLRFEAEFVYKEDAGCPSATTMAPNWGAPFADYLDLSASERNIVARMDINRDGDRDDTFVMGKIYRYILAPAGSTQATANASNLRLAREPMSDQVMLRVNPSNTQLYNADFDGDATTPQSALDPLFLMVGENGPNGTPINAGNIASDGRAIMVTTWHGDFDHLKKGFVVRKNQITVKYRNLQ